MRRRHSGEDRTRTGVAASQSISRRPTALLQRDELFWVVVAAAGFSLILVYLASAQPWRRWRPMRAASLIAQASRMRVSNHHLFVLWPDSSWLSSAVESDHDRAGIPRGRVSSL